MKSALKKSIATVICFTLYGCCIFPAYWAEPDYRASIQSYNYPYENLKTIELIILEQGFKRTNFTKVETIEKFNFEKELTEDNVIVHLQASLKYQKNLNYFSFEVVGFGANYAEKAKNVIDGLIQLLKIEAERFTPEVEIDSAGFNAKPTI